MDVRKGFTWSDEGVEDAGGGRERKNFGRDGRLRHGGLLPGEIFEGHLERRRTWNRGRLFFEVYYSDDYTEDYLTPEMATPTTPLAIVKRWTSMPLDFAPGTKWQYSNTNYGLAALIVEKVAGQPFF